MKTAPRQPLVKPKKLGTLKNKIRVPAEFNDPLPVETLATFGLDLPKS